MAVSLLIDNGEGKEEISGGMISVDAWRSRDVGVLFTVLNIHIMFMFGPEQLGLIVPRVVL
jgi:hypothetical protein